MNRKHYFFFKVLAFFLVGFPLSVVSPKLAFSDQPLIIDHTCTDISQIPESAIEQAKINLHIAYGHTSHGSQLTTGMTGLVSFANNGNALLLEPRTDLSDTEVNRICDTVREAAFGLYRYLGSGFREKVYQRGLVHRCRKAGLDVQVQPRDI